VGINSFEPTKKISMAISGVNILYYDSIAAEYDEQLNRDERNFFIRDTVTRKFVTVVNGRLVLDFGGGTGRDFGWLLKYQYQIMFCEPSRAMRQIAWERKAAEFRESTIFFFEDEQADFRNWTDTFPFEQKVDAVLANFAVINCIPDIDCLFDKLAMALKQGGQVIALVLDDHLIRRFRSNARGTIISFFSGKPVKLFIDHKNYRQEVYVHSIKSILKNSRAKFDLISHSRLKGYGFRLIHLRKK
jgi:SAM-dependent methyltransferase